MAIEFTCDCGRALYLRDELAGRQVRCPECQRTLTVPYPTAHYAEPVPPHTEQPPEVRYDPLLERSEDVASAPEAVASEPPPSPREAPKTGGTGAGSIGSVIGGLAMMILGGALALIGWQANRPPIRGLILFAIGLVTFIRGLTGLGKR